MKEDGSQAQLDEKLEFKVVSSQKLQNVSSFHTPRVFEDEKKAEETAKRKTQAKATAKAVKQVKEVNSAEKDYTWRYFGIGCPEISDGS